MNSVQYEICGIQKWINEVAIPQKENTDLLYKSAALEQAIQIRDFLPRIAALYVRSLSYSDRKDGDIEFNAYNIKIEIISEHISKSTRLPVYRVTMRNGIMRLLANSSWMV